MNAALHTSHVQAAYRLRDWPPLAPFSPVAMDFVAAFSQALRAAPGARAHAELVALAFWMRPGHLEALRAKLARATADSVLLARGTVFHIAPGNVDSIFVYSWFLSLLCGNRNIVRLPSRASPQLALLCSVLDALLADPRWQEIAKRVVLTRYPREDEASTAHFSSVCNLRVVWGGDTTIAEIRRIALPARAGEICFANRFSMSLIHASGWLQATPEKRVQWLSRFHADTFSFGQMACSSPRLVAWLGLQDEVQAAREQFWNGLHTLTSQRSSGLMAIDCVNKSVASDLIALRVPALIPASPHNSINRVELAPDDVKPVIFAELHCGAGLFLETRIEHLEELRLFVDERMQTLTHAGFNNIDSLRDYLQRCTPSGIDRALPFGLALEFASVWDGQDLLQSFTRQVCLA